MKIDINDTLRTEGDDGVRSRHDRAWKYNGRKAESSEKKHDDFPDPKVAAGWKQGTFTAKQLQDMTFPPVSWIVKDMIPAEGVALLCSKPKFGKSWLAYDLCIACTADRFTLGTIKPRQGDVLYLALEDSKRRLQKRMSKLLPTFNAAWPDKLTITTEWRHLHEGGLDDIRAWYEQTKTNGGKPIMAVVDILAKVRKPSGNKQVYESDYAAITGLSKLANELGIAIIIIHHTRKMAADDLMETVSGSFGITGAVDTVLVMANKASGSVLDIRGRDVESAELAIEFNKETCRWKILGDSAEIHVSAQRAKIIAAFKEAGGPMRITELVEATEMKRNPLEALLGKMVRDQIIKRIKTGIYAHKDYVEPPPPDKPTRAKSDRSDRSDFGHHPGRISQTADHKENKDEILPSDRSDRKSTDGRSSLSSNPVSVKTRSDRSDDQIESQAIDKIATSNVSNLIGRKSDRSDRSDEADPEDQREPEPGKLRCLVTIREIRHHEVT